MPPPSLQSGGIFSLLQAYLPKAEVGDSCEEEEENEGMEEKVHMRDQG